MNTVRIPDLWLKHEMAVALTAFLPSDSASGLTNRDFVSYVRGGGERLSTFNKWLVGDAGLKPRDEVPLLAAVYERLVHKGIARNDDQDTFKADVKTRNAMSLNEPLLGTVFDFAAALADAVIECEPDQTKAKLEAILSKALFRSLVENADTLAPLTIIHGATRNWVSSSSSSERLAKRDEVMRVPGGNFIQYLVPPSSIDRLVFGFEMLSDRRLIGAKWPDIANWFAPQLQPAGQSLAVLEEPADDASAYRADGEGESMIQIIAVDLNGLSTSDEPGPVNEKPPNDLYKLIGNCPAGWPDGYAETFAMLTYVSRLALRQTKVFNKGQSSGGATDAPPRAQLHIGRYRVE